jgi:hypothetical protein
MPETEDKHLNAYLADARNFVTIGDSNHYPLLLDSSVFAPFRTDFGGARALENPDAAMIDGLVNSSGSYLEQHLYLFSESSLRADYSRFGGMLRSRQADLSQFQNHERPTSVISVHTFPLMHDVPTINVKFGQNTASYGGDPELYKYMFVKNPNGLANTLGEMVANSRNHSQIVAYEILRCDYDRVWDFIEFRPHRERFSQVAANLFKLESPDMPNEANFPGYQVRFFDTPELPMGRRIFELVFPGYFEQAIHHHSQGAIKVMLADKYQFPKSYLPED